MLMNIARWIKLYVHEGMKYLPSAGKYSFDASKFNRGMIYRPCVWFCCRKKSQDSH